MSELKLYRVYKIKFWSLRVVISNYGASEIDKQVTRKARVVLGENGKQFQLVYKEDYWDYVNDIDQECIDIAPFRDFNDIEVLTK